MDITLADVRTAEQRIGDTIDVIQRLDSDVRAFVDVDFAGAVQIAKDLDQRPEDQRGPLHGVPIAVKEIIDVAGMKCAWGSPAHAGRKPETDAKVVGMLRAAGANVIGTTVSAEYAIAAAGPTRNPVDQSRTPGGSSSGSAAAVAAGMVPLAVGTQTIGSIIRPALYCGVPGLKTTFGSISLKGVMPLQSRLDHLGFLASNWALITQALRAVNCPETTASPGKCYWVAPPSGVELSKGVFEAREVAKAIVEEAGFQIVDAPAVSERRADLEYLAARLTVAGLAENHADDFERDPGSWSARAAELLKDGEKILNDDIERLAEECTDNREWIADIAGAGDIFLSDAIEGPATPWAHDNTGPNRLQGMWSALGLPTAAWTVTTEKTSGLAVGLQVSAAAGSDIWLTKTMAGLQQRGGKA